MLASTIFFLCSRFLYGHKSYDFSECMAFSVFQLRLSFQIGSLTIALLKLLKV